MVHNIDKLLLPTLDTLTAHIAVLSSQGDIVFVNKSWRIFANENGIQPDAVSVGVNYLDVCQKAFKSGSDEAGQFLNGLKLVLSGREKSFNLEYPCHSANEKRWFIGKVTALTVKEGCHAVISHEDITERKLNEIELGKSHFRLNKLTSKTPTYICELNASGKITFVNRTYEGLNADQVIGTKLINWFPKTQQAQITSLIEKAVSDKAPGKMSYTIPDPGGVLRSYIADISPFENETGEPAALFTATEITELKQMEKELKESKEKFQSLTENSPHIIFTIDRTGEILFMNRAPEGVEPNQIIGTSMFDHIDSECHERIKKHVSDIFNGEKQSQYEVRGIGPGGARSDYLSNISPYEMSSGKVMSAIISTQDITHRKQLQQEVDAGRDRLIKILNTVDSCIYVTDMDTHEILFMNHCMKQLYDTDLTGKTCWKELQENKHGPCEFCTNDKLLDDRGSPKGVYIWEHYNEKLGKWFEVRDQAVEWTNNKLARLEMAVDITRRKKMEKNLRESEIKFRALIDNTPAVIFMKDLEGRYFLINHTCETVLGIKNEDIAGKTPHDILPADVADQFVANDKEVIETGSPQSVEETIPIADGFITVLSTQFPLRDSQGKMYGICGISTDISERKDLENELKKINMDLEDKVMERTVELEDMNAALKVLLKKNEKDRFEIEEKILSNYESLILPFITKLKRNMPEKKHENLLDIIESNLKEVTSEFSKKLNDPTRCLTPTEIQIAAMVKQGLTNKEIADILNIAVRTVTSHRDAIRTKLGIKNRKVNLRAYLSSH